MANTPNDFEQLKQIGQEHLDSTGRTPEQVRARLKAFVEGTGPTRAPKATPKAAPAAAPAAPVYDNKIGVQDEELVDKMLAILEREPLLTQRKFDLLTLVVDLLTNPNALNKLKFNEDNLKKLLQAVLNRSEAEVDAALQQSTYAENDLHSRAGSKPRLYGLLLDIHPEDVTDEVIEDIRTCAGRMDQLKDTLKLKVKPIREAIDFLYANKLSDERGQLNKGIETSKADVKEAMQTDLDKLEAIVLERANASMDKDPKDTSKLPKSVRENVPNLPLEIGKTETILDADVIEEMLEERTVSESKTVFEAVENDPDLASALKTLNHFHRILTMPPALYKADFMTKFGNSKRGDLRDRVLEKLEAIYPGKLPFAVSHLHTDSKGNMLQIIAQELGLMKDPEGLKGAVKRVGGAFEEIMSEIASESKTRTVEDVRQAFANWAVEGPKKS